MSLNAQSQTKKTRILFILDASSSMTYDWNKNYNRFAIARNILLQIVDSIYAVNNEVEFGVRLYGTEFPAQEKNCTDSRLLVPFNLQNVNQIKQSLLYATPIGWSPIAYSLKESARTEINNTSQYDYSIIFITDGGESCGGDICETYLTLLKNKISITPYIIGLDNNANLKSYYDCLGKFVSVLEVDDIPKAVKLIVDENRPILNKKKNLNLKTVFSNTPIKKSDPIKPKPIVKPVKPKPKVVVKRVWEPMPQLNARSVSLTEGFIPNYSPLKISPLYQRLEYKIDMDLEPPVKRIVRNITFIKPKSIQLPTQINFPTAPIYPNPLFTSLEYTFNFETPKPVIKKKVLEDLPFLRPFEPRHRLVYAFRVPRPVYAPPLYDKLEYRLDYTPIKRDTVVKRIVNTTKPKADKVDPIPSSANGPNVKVSREVIPSDQTLVQVFFINKFQKRREYRNATPTVIMTDAQTKKEAKRFIRTVNRGVPELKQIEAGTYNFTVRGENNLLTPDIRIDANSINKVYIEASDGTIEFRYDNNPKRPVDEFQAVVNPRFENRNKTVVQECRDKLFYAPATYYVEINTMPTTRFAMVELDFGVQKVIKIPEPGFLQINNTSNMGRIEFYHNLNDKYVRFHTMKITGNIIDQKIMLQPSRRGPYKVVFYKDIRMPAAGTKEIMFRVKSNEITQLTLQ
jgi:hypothetical protein